MPGSFVRLRAAPGGFLVISVRAGVLEPRQVGSPKFQCVGVLSTRTMGVFLERTDTSSQPLVWSKFNIVSSTLRNKCPNSSLFRTPARKPCLRVPPPTMTVAEGGSCSSSTLAPWPVDYVSKCRQALCPGASSHGLQRCLTMEATHRLAGTLTSYITAPPV